MSAHVQRAASSVTGFGGRRAALDRCGKRVGLAGEDRDGSGDLGEAGMEVAAGDRWWGVSGEGLGDRVAGCHTRWPTAGYFTQASHWM